MTAYCGILQGYRGWTTISPSAVTPIRVLCRTGSRLSMPRNLDIPYPISNQAFGELNYADGLQFPVVDLTMVPMTSWWSAANLNAWFATPASSCDDLAAVGSGGIDFGDASDAAGGYGGLAPGQKILNPKGASFTLSSSKGEPINFTARFMGTDLAAATTPIPTTGLTGTPLEFNQVSFSGGLLNTRISGFSLTFDNNITPNPELDGTLRPKEQNAGIVMGMLHLMTNGGVALADGTTGTIVVAGVNFAVSSLIPIDPLDRTQQAGRVNRPFRYKILGSTTAFPVTIS